MKSFLQSLRGKPRPNANENSGTASTPSSSGTAGTTRTRPASLLSSSKHVPSPKQKPRSPLSVRKSPAQTLIDTQLPGLFVDEIDNLLLLDRDSDAAAMRSSRISIMGLLDGYTSVVHTETNQVEGGNVESTIAALSLNSPGHHRATNSAPASSHHTPTITQSLRHSTIGKQSLPSPLRRTGEVKSSNMFGIVTKGVNMTLRMHRTTDPVDLAGVSLNESTQCVVHTLDALDQVSKSVEGIEACAEARMAPVLVKVLVLMFDARCGGNASGSANLKTRTASSCTDDSSEYICATDNEEEEEEEVDGLSNAVGRQAKEPAKEPVRSRLFPEDHVASGLLPESLDASKRKRSQVIVEALTNVLCRLLEHRAPILTMLVEPELALEKLFKLLVTPVPSNALYLRDAVTRIIEVLASRSLDIEVLNHMLVRDQASIFVEGLRSLAHFPTPSVYLSQDAQSLSSATTTSANFVKRESEASILDEEEEYIESHVEGLDQCPQVIYTLHLVNDLLRASARTTVALIDRFAAVGGYQLLHSLVVQFPGSADDILIEVRRIICLGRGFAQAESEANTTGAVHPVYEARNLPAFGVVASLLFDLCLPMMPVSSTSGTKKIVVHHSEDGGGSNGVNETEQKKKNEEGNKKEVKDTDCRIQLQSRRDFAWSLMTKTQAQALALTQKKLGSVDVESSVQHTSTTQQRQYVENDNGAQILNVEALRLPLLHCILAVYSSNPTNFGVLDGSFGVMSTLVTALAFPRQIHLEFLLMVIKLLELVTMGMDYQPVCVLQTLCHVTIPLLTQAGARSDPVNMFGSAKRNPNHNSSNISQANLKIQTQQQHGEENKFEPMIDRNMEEENSDIQNGIAIEGRDPNVYSLQVVCATLVKMLQSDEAYRDVLRECGLFEHALFPLFVHTPLKHPPDQWPTQVVMLHSAVLVVCEMLRGNLRNQQAVRENGVHRVLYRLVSHSTRYYFRRRPMDDTASTPSPSYSTSTPLPQSLFQSTRRTDPHVDDPSSLSRKFETPSVAVSGFVGTVPSNIDNQSVRARRPIRSARNSTITIGSTQTNLTLPPLLDPLSSALLVLVRLVAEDGPGIQQDVAALLESVQLPLNDYAAPLEFKAKILGAIASMLRRNHRVKDTFRQQGGYESLLSVLLSLDSALDQFPNSRNAQRRTRSRSNGSDSRTRTASAAVSTSISGGGEGGTGKDYEKAAVVESAATLEEDERMRDGLVFALVNSVFQVFNLSMAGDHEANAVYTRDEIRYDTIASTLKLMGLLGSSFAVPFVSMMVNFAVSTGDTTVEVVSDDTDNDLADSQTLMMLSGSGRGDDISDSQKLLQTSPNASATTDPASSSPPWVTLSYPGARINNVATLQVVFSELEALHPAALASLLTGLMSLVNPKSAESPFNCQILAETSVVNKLISMPDTPLEDAEHKLHSLVSSFVIRVCRHTISSQTLRLIIARTYRAPPIQPPSSAINTTFSVGSTSNETAPQSPSVWTKDDSRDTMLRLWRTHGLSYATLCVLEDIAASVECANPDGPYVQLLGPAPAPWSSNPSVPPPSPPASLTLNADASLNRKLTHATSHRRSPSHGRKAPIDHVDQVYDEWSDSVLGDPALVRTFASHASTYGVGYAQIPGLGKRNWPPVSGFTFSCWFTLGHSRAGVDVGDHVTGGSMDPVVCSIRSVDGLQYFRAKLVLVPENLHGDNGEALRLRRVLRVWTCGVVSNKNATAAPKSRDLASAAPHCVTFEEVEFLPGMWYHLMLTHKSEKGLGSLLDKSSSGKVSLHCNGVLVGSKKLPYPVSKANGGMRTSVVIGGDNFSIQENEEQQQQQQQHGANNESGSGTVGLSGDWCWRLGPFMLCESGLSDAHARSLYLHGPQYTGALSRTGCVHHDLRAFGTSVLERIWIYCNDETDAALTYLHSSGSSGDMDGEARDRGQTIDKELSGDYGINDDVGNGGVGAVDSQSTTFRARKSFGRMRTISEASQSSQRNLGDLRTRYERSASVLNEGLEGNSAAPMFGVRPRCYSRIGGARARAETAETVLETSAEWKYHESVTNKVSELGFASSSWRAFMLECDTMMTSKPRVAPELVVFSFNGARKSTLSDSRLMSSSASSSARSSSSSRQVLVNSTVSLPGVIQHHPLAVLRGGALAIGRVGLSDSSRVLGGVSMFMLLLHRARSADAVGSLLRIIRDVMFANDLNRALFRKVDGVRVLGWLLHEKFASPRSLLREALVPDLVGLTSAGESKDALIMDTELVHHLLLNYQVWGAGAHVGKLQWKVFVHIVNWLNNSVDVSNANREINLSILQRLGLGDWALQMLVLVVIDSPKNDISLFLDVVAVLVELLDNILRRFLAKRDLYAVFKFILVTLPDAGEKHGSGGSSNLSPKPIPSPNKTQHEGDTDDEEHASTCESVPAANDDDNDFDILRTVTERIRHLDNFGKAIHDMETGETDGQKTGKQSSAQQLYPTSPPAGTTVSSLEHMTSPVRVPRLRGVSGAGVELLPVDGLPRMSRAGASPVNTTAQSSSVASTPETPTSYAQGSGGATNDNHGDVPSQRLGGGTDEDALMSIRKMLLWMLLDLKEPRTSHAAFYPSSEAYTHKALTAYSEISSAQMFSCLLHYELDQDTVLLSTRLLAETVQASPAFAKHFFASGGEELLTRVMRHRSQCVPLVAIVLRMLFGRSVRGLPPPVLLHHDGNNDESHSNDDDNNNDNNSNGSNQSANGGGEEGLDGLMQTRARQVIGGETASGPRVSTNARENFLKRRAMLVRRAEAQSLEVQEQPMALDALFRTLLDCVAADDDDNNSLPSRRDLRYTFDFPKYYLSLFRSLNALLQHNAQVVASCVQALCRKDVMMTELKVKFNQQRGDESALKAPQVPSDYIYQAELPWWEEYQSCLDVNAAVSGLFLRVVRESSDLVSLLSMPHCLAAIAATVVAEAEALDAVKAEASKWEADVRQLLQHTALSTSTSTSAKADPPRNNSSIGSVHPSPHRQRHIQSVIYRVLQGSNSSTSAADDANLNMSSIPTCDGSTASQPSMGILLLLVQAAMTSGPAGTSAGTRLPMFRSGSVGGGGGGRSQSEPSNFGGANNMGGATSGTGNNNPIGSTGGEGEAGHGVGGGGDHRDVGARVLQAALRAYPVTASSARVVWYQTALLQSLMPMLARVLDEDTWKTAVSSAQQKQGRILSLGPLGAFVDGPMSWQGSTVAAGQVRPAAVSGVLVVLCGRASFGWLPGSEHTLLELAMQALRCCDAGATQVSSKGKGGGVYAGLGADVMRSARGLVLHCIQTNLQHKQVSSMAQFLMAVRRNFIALLSPSLAEGGVSVGWDTHKHDSAEVMLMVVNENNSWEDECFSFAVCLIHLAYALLLNVCVRGEKSSREWELRRCVLGLWDELSMGPYAELVKCILTPRATISQRETHVAAEIRAGFDLLFSSFKSKSEQRRANTRGDEGEEGQGDGFSAIAASAWGEAWDDEESTEGGTEETDDEDRVHSPNHEHGLVNGGVDTKTAAAAAAAAAALAIFNDSETESEIETETEEMKKESVMLENPGDIIEDAKEGEEEEEEEEEEEDRKVDTTRVSHKKKHHEHVQSIALRKFFEWFEANKDDVTLVVKSHSTPVWERAYTTGQFGSRDRVGIPQQQRPVFRSTTSDDAETTSPMTALETAILQHQWMRRARLGQLPDRAKQLGDAVQDLVVNLHREAADKFANWRRLSLEHILRGRRSWKDVEARVLQERGPFQETENASDGVVSIGSSSGSGTDGSSRARAESSGGKRRTWNGVTRTGDGHSNASNNGSIVGTGGVGHSKPMRWRLDFCEGPDRMRRRLQINTAPGAVALTVIHQGLRMQEQQQLKERRQKVQDQQHQQQQQQQELEEEEKEKKALERKGNQSLIDKHQALAMPGRSASVVPEMDANAMKNVLAKLRSTQHYGPGNDDGDSDDDDNDEDDEEDEDDENTACSGEEDSESEMSVASSTDTSSATTMSVSGDAIRRRTISAASSSSTYMSEEDLVMLDTNGSSAMPSGPMSRSLAALSNDWNSQHVSGLGGATMDPTAIMTPRRRTLFSNAVSEGHELSPVVKARSHKKPKNKSKAGTPASLFSKLKRVGSRRGSKSKNKGRGSSGSTNSDNGEVEGGGDVEGDGGMVDMIIDFDAEDDNNAQVKDIVATKDIDEHTTTSESVTKSNEKDKDREKEVEEHDQEGDESVDGGEGERGRGNRSARAVVDQLVEKGLWRSDDRILAELDHADRKPTEVFPCWKVEGLQKKVGILLVCQTAVYIIANYTVSAGGRIEEVIPESEDLGFSGGGRSSSIGTSSGGTRGGGGRASPSDALFAGMRARSPTTQLSTASAILNALTGSNSGSGGGGNQSPTSSAVGLLRSSGASVSLSSPRSMRSLPTSDDATASRLSRGTSPRNGASSPPLVPSGLTKSGPSSLVLSASPRGGSGVDDGGEINNEAESRQVDHECIKLSYEHIREFYRRRYMFGEVGLEFFAVDGTNFLLVFSSEHDRNVVFTHLMNTPLSNSILNSTANSGRGRGGLVGAVAGATGGGGGGGKEGDDARTSVMQDMLSTSTSLNAFMAPFKKFKASMTRQWVSGRISNFAYLMYLNTVSGRSYNDLTQYPVFPWTLCDYESDKLDLQDPKVYRDLSKPMGVLTDERQEHFAERYAALESVVQDTGMQPFHYGTHYSCSGYVLQFLLRLEPYARMAVELQGGQFDRPDRLFKSIQGTWRSASGRDFNAQDVRELLPEFYFQPLFLLNANKFELGVTQAGKSVADVELPKWAHGSAFEFVRLHRQALESPYVSEHLNEWIDLVFGHKQRGQAAVDAMNVFHPLTYDDGVNIDAIEDEVMRNATIAQIHNFGQTPKKLFHKAHPKRQPPAVHGDHVDSLDSSTLQWHRHQAPPLVIPGRPLTPPPFRAREQVLRNPPPQDRFPGGVNLVLEENISVYVMGRTHAAVSALRVTNGKVYACAGLTIPMPRSGTKYLSWEAENGSLQINSQTSTTLQGEVNRVIDIYERLHQGTINVVRVTDNGKHVLTGGSDALVVVWTLQRTARDHYALEICETLCGHDDAVTCMDISSSYATVVTGSADRSVIVWDLGRRVLVHTLRGGHGSAVKAVSINQSTGNFCSMCSNTLAYWHVNGSLLSRTNLEVDVLGVATTVLATSCPEYQYGITFVTGHESGIVGLWDVMYESDLQSPPESDKFLSSASSNSLTWSSGDSTGTAAAVNARDDDPTRVLAKGSQLAISLRGTLAQHNNAVTALHVTADGRMLVSGDSSCKVVVWSSYETTITR